MNDAALSLRFVGASIRAQMEYPGSTLLLTLGQFAITAVEILAVIALFHRFGRLSDWTLAEVAVFYGIANVTYSLSELICRGFDAFGQMFIRSGDFDRVLLRPRSAALQVVFHTFRLSRFGRFAQGLIVLGAATFAFGFQWTPGAVLLAGWAVVGGIAFFTGLYVLQATLCFWTVDALEVANMLTHGGVTAGQYPLSIYAEWFRSLMTFVVPLACVAYFPVLAVIGRSDPLGAPDWFLPAAPLAGFVFLAASFLVWRLGVGKYTSTGS